MVRKLRECWCWILRQQIWACLAEWWTRWSRFLEQVRHRRSAWCHSQKFLARRNPSSSTLSSWRIFWSKNKVFNIRQLKIFFPRLFNLQHFFIYSRKMLDNYANKRNKSFTWKFVYPIKHNYIYEPRGLGGGPGKGRERMIGWQLTSLNIWIKVLIFFWQIMPRLVYVQDHFEQLFHQSWLPDRETFAWRRDTHPPVSWASPPRGWLPTGTCSSRQSVRWLCPPSFLTPLS